MRRPAIPAPAAAPARRVPRLTLKRKPRLSPHTPSHTPATLQGSGAITPVIARSDSDEAIHLSFELQRGFFRFARNDVCRLLPDQYAFSFFVSSENGVLRRI